MTKEQIGPFSSEKEPEKKFSMQDFEKIGRELLDIDPNIARGYLRASGLPEAEVQNILKSGPEKKDQPPPEMSAEEKKKLFADMAKEFAKKAKTAPSGDQGPDYKRLANIYKAGAKNIGKDIKGKNK